MQEESRNRYQYFCGGLHKFFYAVDLDDIDLTSSCGFVPDTPFNTGNGEGPFFLKIKRRPYIRAESLRETKNKFATRWESHVPAFRLSRLDSLSRISRSSQPLQRAIYHRPIDRPPASIEKLPSTQ